MTRLSHIFLLLVFVTPYFVVGAAYGAVFPRDLKVGDTGEDVRQLQVLLNARQETMLTSSGPGSSGNETTYFGSLTALAVARYQELYASEILAPLGLFIGTGFFGQATRTHINDSAKVTSRGRGGSDETLPAENKMLTFEEITELNRKNIDEAVVVVENSLKDAGFSTKEISEVETEIRRQANMDFEDIQKELEQARAKFGEKVRTPEEIVEDMEEQYGIVIPDGPMTTLAEALIQMILPKPVPAHAQYLIPVGAMVLGYYMCGCSGLWYIIMGPPRPGTVTYETGTQLYLNRNLPFARWFLGYSTPINPTCWLPGTPCTPVPSSYGILTPVVGSSPL